MHTLDPLSPTKGPGRSRAYLTYNCEPGAFSKENLGVHTVTWGKEENRIEAWRGGALAGVWKTLE